MDEGGPAGGRAGEKPGAGLVARANTDEVERTEGLSRVAPDVPSSIAATKAPLAGPTIRAPLTQLSREIPVRDISRTDNLP